MIKFKRFIPNSIKQFLKDMVQEHNINGEFSNKRKIFVALAADYGNLGDVAISYAQYQFLKINFPDYEVIDVPISRNFTNIRKIRKNISKDDIITIVGGGNLTDLYQSIENCRLQWVKSFPKNKIVLFPQTIDFSTTEPGMKSFQNSKKIYEGHSNLYLFAREKISFNIMKKKLSCNVFLCPDIVLTQNQYDSEVIKDGVLLCIRDDKESIISDDERRSFLNIINKKYGSEITITDTHIGKGGLSWDKRNKELELLWSQFRASKVVVTDRLHGMIFSVITKTPCVVLPNNNHKILQTYQNWLSDLKHIKLLNTFDEEQIINSINELKNLDTNQLAFPDLDNHYKKIVNIIK